ncbi:MAG: sigma-70 family RNA polymerase sigma factor [Dehalococcoidia bacterium]|nr:MAG: sigma-70 family RNA polymerase sigma factor [Dehalococcoidia bacterium]
MSTATASRALGPACGRATAVAQPHASEHLQKGHRARPRTVIRGAGVGWGTARRPRLYPRLQFASSRSSGVSVGRWRGVDELIARLRRREPDALADLYDTTYRRAYGLALRVLGGDAAAAEDAVQEGYLALWRQADRLSADRGSVEGLLLTIVHRRAVEAVRVRIRQRESGDAVPDRVDLHAVDLLEAAITSLEGDRVRSALLALSPEHREAIELAYFAQLSHREIAERTGVPLGTVKSRMHHAIRALRGSLGLGTAS